MKIALMIAACCAGFTVACSVRSRDEPAPSPAGGAGDPAGTTGTTTLATPRAGSGGGANESDGVMTDSSDAADSAPPDRATREDAGPAGPSGSDAWTAGDYPPDPMSDDYLEISGLAGQNGHTRQYKVHVPPSYDPSVPTPTVFCIHGLTQDAVLFCVIGSGMLDKSDREGFVLVMPNGYDASWNAGTCCGSASSEQLDDVALMRAIFAEVSKHVNIDRGRVYATGFSNGGFMSYRLACDAADIFTAVAPSAGGIGTNELSMSGDFAEVGSVIGATNTASDFTACAPSQPVSVLDLHGTDDPLVPFSFQAASLDLIAQHDGCAATTEPADDPMSRGDTTCVSVAGCPSGIEVTGCSVEGGGHNWFGSPDCGTAAGDLGCAIVGYNSTVLVNTDVVWSFFERHGR